MTTNARRREFSRSQWCILFAVAYSVISACYQYSIIPEDFNENYEQSYDVIISNISSNADANTNKDSGGILSANTSKSNDLLTNSNDDKVPNNTSTSNGDATSDTKGTDDDDDDDSDKNADNVSPTKNNNKSDAKVTNNNDVAKSDTKETDADDDANDDDSNKNANNASSTNNKSDTKASKNTDLANSDTKGTGADDDANDDTDDDDTNDDASSAKNKAAKNNNVANSDTKGTDDDDSDSLILNAYENDPIMKTNDNEQKTQLQNNYKKNENKKPLLQSLKCDAYGGPNENAASEMVYWWKIPTDEEYLNPFQQMQMNGDEEKFFLFEPDQAGWNNVRMAMETILSLAISMGRTIVLPPEKRIFLIWENETGNQKHQFTFRDFFHLEEAEVEHAHLKIISMEEYLKKVAMKGLLKDTRTGHVKFPPQNKTNWDRIDNRPLWNYIRSTSYVPNPKWNPINSISYFPANNTDLGPATQKRMQYLLNSMKDKVNPDSFGDRPTAVDAPIIDRFKEHIMKRDKFCFYDEKMQKAPVIHFQYDATQRFLMPFYSFSFYEDWKEALWIKRFMRDHIRYNNELMCAAARVVGAIREKAKEYDPEGNKEGRFHTMHIRRGDFQAQYKRSILSAEDLLKSSKEILDEGGFKTIYISTDEKNKTFFEPFQKHYQVLFLSDFHHLSKEVNSNYHPMVEQLIASRGEIFFGTFYSTFSSYINRLRGYYSLRDKLDGYESGKIQSYYFSQLNIKNLHRKYFAIRYPVWAMEFPISWYNIDKDIEHLK